MTYRPPNLAAKGSYGTDGNIRIYEIADGKARVSFWAVDKQGLVPLGEDGKPKEPAINVYIKVENCKPVVKVGKWMANMSENKDRLYQIRPITGVFPAKFKEFLAPKDQAPAPKMSGGQYPHLIFKPLFELTREDVAGMVVGYKWGLHYNFEARDFEGSTIVDYKPRLELSIHTQELDDFLVTTGIWDRGAMKWQENLLPVMQRRALDANKSFMIYLENGYIKNLIPDSSGAFDEEEPENKLETGVEE